MTIDLKEHFTKKRLTENIGLKILSLIVAVFLWFVVINVTDPVVPQGFRNVPVKIVNSQLITNDGKTLEVLDNSQYITSVTIRAPRSIIQNMGSAVDNISAVADLANLSVDGTSVPIDITTSKYADKVDSIKSSSNTLYVKIENKKTIQLPVLATTSGEIESGYILGDIKPNQNQVRVSGPESIINTVKSASVDVQVTGFTGNISTQSEIVLFDENGEPVSKDNVELNVDSVRVDVEILATKRVPVYYSVSGVAADGYEATGEVKIDPETVVIAGSVSDIANVTSIGIPSADLNITGQKEDMLTVLDLKNYLPRNIRLADSAYNGNVNVTVYIEPIVTEDYGVYARNISIVNIPDGFMADVKEPEEYVKFQLAGLAQNLEKVQFSTFNFRVDFEDYALLNDTTEFKEGEYPLYLVMDLSEGVEIVEPVEITVNLKKKDK